jgi:hypothetical protein
MISGGRSKELGLHSEIIQAIAGGNTTGVTSKQKIKAFHPQQETPSGVDTIQGIGNKGKRRRLNQSITDTGHSSPGDPLPLWAGRDVNYPIIKKKSYTLSKKLFYVLSCQEFGK